MNKNIMKKTKELKFNSIMINSFRPGVGNPIFDRDGLKYHYTSPEAFLNILRNKCVYFTDIRFLNDKKEDIYLIDLLKKYVNKNPDRYKNISKVIHRWIDFNYSELDSIVQAMHYKMKNSRKFVFCSSTEQDSLVMWNYYVNNGVYQGYNLGINIENFLKTFDTNNSKEADPFTVLYGGVLYNKRDQFKEIDSLLEEMEICYQEQGQDFAESQLCLYIDRYSPFYKHPKFMHEKEYRFVIEISEDRLNRNVFSNCFGENNRNIKYEFRTRNGLIIPYLKVPMNKDTVSWITISPITEFGIAKTGVRELLGMSGFSGVQIHQSNIPIRF